MLVSGLFAFAAAAFARWLGRAPARRPVAATVPTGTPGRRRRPWASRARSSGRRAGRRRTVEQLPALLDHVASALRSGVPLASALADATADATAGGEASEASATMRPPGDHGAEQWLADLLAPVQRGARLVDVLDHGRRQAVTPAERLVATALALSARAGRADPAVLETAAEVVRDRQALEREIRVQAAPALASAMVLSAVPPVFLLGAVLLDPQVAGAVRSPVGATCVVVGLTLDVVGGWWMHHMIQGVRP